MNASKALGELEKHGRELPLADLPWHVSRATMDSWGSRHVQGIESKWILKQRAGRHHPLPPRAGAGARSRLTRPLRSLARVTVSAWDAQIHVSSTRSARLEVPASSVEPLRPSWKLI